MIEKYYAAHIKTGLALRQLSSCGPARTRKAVKLKFQIGSDSILLIYREIVQKFSCQLLATD